MRKYENLFIRLVLARTERDEMGDAFKRVLLAAWAFLVEKLDMPLQVVQTILNPIELYVVGYNKYKIKDALPIDEFYKRVASHLADAIKRSKVSLYDILNFGALNVFPKPLQVAIGQAITLNKSQAVQPLIPPDQAKQIDISMYKSPLPESEEEAKRMAKQVIELYKMKGAEEEEAQRKKEEFESFKRRKQQQGLWLEKRPTQNKGISPSEKKEWSSVIDTLKEKSYLNPHILKSGIQGNTTEKSVVDISKLPSAAKDLKKKQQEMLQNAQKLDQVANTMKQIETKLQ